MKKSIYAVLLAASLAALTACSSSGSSSSASGSSSAVSSSVETQAETQAQTETTETVGTEETNTAAQESEETSAQAQTPDYTLYEDVLGQYSSDMDVYAVYDIDQDGTDELLVKDGTCEADYIWYVYTIEDGEAVQLDSFDGGHSALYSNASGAGIYKLYGQMGDEVISLFTLEGGTLSEEVITEKQIGENEDYDTPDGTELPTAALTDYSLIENLL